MAEPFWLPEAAARCPTEAAEVVRLNNALQALPKDAPMGTFIDRYERMLWARDRLYEAWISLEMDA